MGPDVTTAGLGVKDAREYYSSVQRLIWTPAEELGASSHIPVFMSRIFISHYQYQWMPFSKTLLVYTATL